MDGNAAQLIDSTPNDIAASHNDLGRVVREFNNTAVAYPEHAPIQAIFETRAAASGDAVALICGDQQLSYAELNRRANQLAHALAELGLQPEQRVALLVERSIDSVVGMLGILKAGGAYVPLDPHYPPDRLRFMVEDSAPFAVVTQSVLEVGARQLSPTVLFMDRGFSCQEEENLPNDGLSSRSLAYVVYTSGSTGTPKGVMVDHRSVVRLVVNSTYAPVDELDCVSHCSSPSFDATTWEVWAALLNGARLLIVPQSVLLEPVMLNQLLVSHGVTAMWITIGLFNEYADLLEGAFSRLNYVLTGGDAMNPATARRVLRKSKPPRHLLNVYGPTETTTYASGFVVTAIAPDALSVSIGQPISNTTVYVLDECRQTVPIGTRGELYIGGPGVARGYLNRPDLTAERFVPDPFSLSGSDRLYRTGDLGRWRADGALEHLGRNDLQVKIRGFRVEPGEIEAVLQRVPWVRQAAVVAREVQPGDMRVFAFVVADAAEMTRDHLSRQLRAHARTVLPQYMVPANFVVLDALPLTSNGKVDKRALPQPDLTSESEYEAPNGETEKAVAAVWSELLRVTPVGRRDNFFELGGHSLLMVRMMERLRQIGIPGDAIALFAGPTLAGFCRELVEADEEQELPPNLIPDNCASIQPEMLTLVRLQPEEIQHIVERVPGGARNVQDIYPLTSLQAGLLFHNLLSDRGADVYVRPILLTVESREALDRLIAALEQVIDRHDVLRTAFFWDKLSQPVQVVYRRAALPVRRSRLAAGLGAARQLSEQMLLKSQKMDLQQAPLMSLHAMDAASGQPFHVILKIHHSICDNVSLDAMFRELATAIDGAAVESGLQVPFRNHVAKQLALSREFDAETHFRRKLGEVEEPTAPFGIVDARGDGDTTEEVTEELDEAIGERARVAARLLGVSIASVFHAAWALVVSCTTGMDDVVFGSVLLGRMRSSGEANRALGMFINTLPLRLRVDVSAAELVARTQSELVELLQYEHASLATAQRCSAIAGSTPLFSSLFNYLHADPAGSADPFGASSGVEVVRIAEWTNYPITLTVEERQHGFALRANADRSIGPERVVQYMKRATSSLVAALETSPLVLAATLQVLPATERHQVIAAFNATEQDVPTDAVVHGLFEEQARRRPKALAVIAGSEQLTYGELDALANSVASELVARGVRAGDLVAVFAERDLSLVTGLLGVMKVGGAYVPIDVGYPQERIAHILADCGPKAILTQSAVMGLLPPSDLPRLVIGEIAAADSAGVFFRQPVTSNDLVYVIYTSGSTGLPKGAMLEHRNVVNLIAWTQSAFDIREGTRCSSVASVGFDASAWEIWQALCTGATLTLAPASASNDPDALLDWWMSQDLDVSFIPTPLAELAATRGLTHPTLKTLLVGGDRLRRLVVPERISLINNYGPTETAVVATSGVIEPEESVFHIGRPVGNGKIYILDKHGKPVPIGVAGEIHIGGAGVGRGYLNRESLTREKFVANPFETDSAARMYKSGDLARWRPDGTIEYLGRNDDQVKIRGFRIELGEIESQLARQPAVQEAVVVAREDAGSKRLIAYVTARPGADLVLEDLRAHLKAALPDYMIPAAFVVLQEFPLTRNGKLDRKALPAPRDESFPSRQYEAPQGETEVVLAAIWRELLSVPVVGRDDNFFDLGGHSLLATQLKVRIGFALSVEMPVAWFFEHPTLRQMAARIDSLRLERMMEKLTAGGDEVEKLLRKVASMPDGQVRDWVRELRNGVK